MKKMREKRRAYRMYKKFQTTENYNRYTKALQTYKVKWESSKAVKLRETNWHKM